MTLDRPVVKENTSLVFRSSTQGGFSNAIESDPRHVEARKRPGRVDVRFADAECIVQTTEGMVHAKAGDAILTGSGGEHWRVSRGHFSKKYVPVPPTVAGDGGPYRALPYRILALCMGDPFEVILSDGISRLSGRRGDWLVDYGDGSLGIVAPPIFAGTYEILA